MTGAVLGVKFGGRLDLGTQVGRCIHQVPIVIVGADRQLRLASWFTLKRSLAQPTTVGTTAIPLRKAAAGGRAQDLDPHAGRLDLRGAVAVNFAIQCDLVEVGFNPGHVWLLRLIKKACFILGATEGSRQTPPVLRGTFSTRRALQKGRVRYHAKSPAADSQFTSEASCITCFGY
jgi:hypothetical protein